MMLKILCLKMIAVKFPKEDIFRVSTARFDVINYCLNVNDYYFINESIHVILIFVALA